MNIITEAALLEAGYKRYSAPLTSPNAECLYEKIISDDKGIKYFLHVDVYNLSRYGLNEMSFDFNVQFNTLRGDRVNVQNLAKCSIAEHEAFFEEVWQSVNSITYMD